MVSMGVRACPGKGGKGRKETDFAGLSPFGQVCVREKKKNDGVSIRDTGSFAWRGHEVASNKPWSS
jgi:hypothetical protein